MRFVTSKQVNIPFIFCPDPVVIDKRKSWGESEDNFQKAPNGAFLKMKDSKTVSHLVQPNSDRTAPVGWVYSSYDNLYDKLPIFVGEKVNKGETKRVKTLDGEINYEAKEDSWVVYNVKNGTVIVVSHDPFYIFNEKVLDFSDLKLKDFEDYYSEQLFLQR